MDALESYTWEIDSTLHWLVKWENKLSIFWMEMKTFETSNSIKFTTQEPEQSLCTILHVVTHCDIHIKKTETSLSVFPYKRRKKTNWTEEEK